MVSIGTTLSPIGKKALLCGSGELGKEVAVELQRYGVEVVALDRYPDAPAMQVAHRSYVVSMLDGARLREIVEREKPDYIIRRSKPLRPTCCSNWKRKATAWCPPRGPRC